VTLQIIYHVLFSESLVWNMALERRQLSLVMMQKCENHYFFK